MHRGSIHATRGRLEGRARGTGGATAPARAALLLVLALAGCHERAFPTFERPPAPVTVAAAITRDVPVYLDEIGRTVAREMVAIRPQVTGRITAIHFEDGADLGAGDLLFTIDPRPYQAELASAQASLAQAKAVLDLARVEFERVAGMVETKAIAEEDYDRRKNAIDVADARVALSEAAVATAELDLEYCSIRSPIDGRAGHRLVDVGNVVTASLGVSETLGGPLLLLQRLDPIYADFTVAEKDLGVVQRQMALGPLKVEVRLPDQPLPGAPTEPVVGELTFLDNAVQEGSGTVMLRATLPNADRRLWPGRFVQCRLVLSTLDDAVLVPAEAAQMSAKGEFVYVVHDDSSAELRAVTTGQRHGELVVVESGLAPGERVVVAGQLGVTPGGKVNVAGEPGAAATAAKEEEPVVGSPGPESGP